MKSRSIFKALALTLALALCIGMMPNITMPVFADTVDSGSCGDNVTYELDSDGVMTISGTGAMADYENAEAVPWYSNMWKVKTLVVQGDVTSIGKNAFNGCNNLETLTITAPVTSIGGSAFGSCSKLTSITIPSGVTSIGGSAFFSCSKLETVTIPSSMSSIGNWNFYNLASLTDIYYDGTEDEWNSIIDMSKQSIDTNQTTIHYNGSGSGGGSGSGSSDPSENEISTSGSTGTSVVTVTAEATTFKVTVPTALAINVSATGVVTCATVAEITNESYGPVKVTGLSISAVTGDGKPNYTIVAYDHNMTTEQVDAKKIGIQLNGETTTDAGSITFAQTWNQIDGNGGTQAITYDANVSASSAAVETCNVANIVFTVSWASLNSLSHNFSLLGKAQAP